MIFFVLIEILSFDKMDQEFFQAVVMTVREHNCITWTLTKDLEKMIDVNYTMCCFQQILEAAPYKTAIMQPLTLHLTKHPSKNSKAC